MLPRALSPWSWLYYPLSWLAVLVLISHVVVFNWFLLKPTDVGGTFMGGGMATQSYLMGWVVATLGLIIAVLCRLPGSITGWIGSGLVPLCIGLWWQLHYPNDAEQVIYSSSPHIIAVYMLIGAVLMGSGLYARSRIKMRTPSRLKMFGQIFVAAALTAIYVGAPVAISKQRALPDCAFNKAGQQLTVCIGDERVIVD
ncbi:hypothetical protein [Pseudomonas sp. TH31]|uniref:hypothetical protein n=1 Tax=Pseudomonas sp. TH31 TaxID=2796396 RepID=UPI001F5B76A5|nr:hypothetical protein [Pseudomonas sp. TH31]